MNHEPQAHHFDRRAFLRRLSTALLGVAGVGAWGLTFWDRHGPSAEQAHQASGFPTDFSVPGQAGRIAAAHGQDRGRTLLEAMGALGGMAAFVRPGDRVLLKVNAAFATPPMLGATTHPDLVRHVIRMCRQAGAAQVMVTDNPINDPASCFELSGIAPAARQEGAAVILPGQDQFEYHTIQGAQLIRHWPVLTGPLHRANKVIGLAPVKDHHRSGASMTLKNWYGLLGGRRNIFHQQVHTIITELGLLLKPTLVILDGTVSMLHNGPTGGSMDDLKPTQTLIVGTDAVAVDTMGAGLLNRTLEDLPFLRMAERAGVGTTSYRDLLKR
jgi:uncharacterized protein (DUF362 family)